MRNQLTLGLMAAATLAAGTLPAAVLSKGPYLIYPNTPSQMQVRWQADATPASSRVDWGTNATYGQSSGPLTESGAARDQHQFDCRITGLTPATRYYYRVLVDAQTNTGSFVAAPAASATRVTFYAFGDTRSYPADMNRVATALLADLQADPDRRQTFSLHVGDWVGADAESNWAGEFFNRAYAGNQQLLAQLPVMGCRGNHEGAAVCYQKYWPYGGSGNCYYSFDYGPVHFTVIDQYIAYTPGSAQYTWLTNDLAASARPFKIAVYHQPAYSGGATGHANDRGAQTNLCPVFAQYGVQVAVNGHNHYYARCSKDGLQHLTTGGGGAPLMRPDPAAPGLVTAAQTLEFLRFEVDGPVMTVTAISTNTLNQVIDSFQVHPIAAPGLTAQPTNGPAAIGRPLDQ